MKKKEAVPLVKAFSMNVMTNAKGSYDESEAVGIIVKVDDQVYYLKADPMSTGNLILTKLST